MGGRVCDEKSKVIGIIISDLHIANSYGKIAHEKKYNRDMSWKSIINRIFLNFRIFTLFPQGIP